MGIEGVGNREGGGRKRGRRGVWKGGRREEEKGRREEKRVRRS